MTLRTWRFDGVPEGTELTKGSTVNEPPRMGSIHLGSAFQAADSYPRLEMAYPENSSIQVTVSWFKFPKETVPIITIRDQKGDARDSVYVDPEGYLSYRGVRNEIPVPLGVMAAIHLDLANGVLTWEEYVPEPLTPPIFWEDDDCEHDWTYDELTSSWWCEHCNAETWPVA